MVLAALCAVWVAPPARAAVDGVIVVGLPEHEARALVDRGPAAAGLGVYPPSRAAGAFLDAFGASFAPAVKDGFVVGVGSDEHAMEGDHGALIGAVQGGPAGSVPRALDADVSILAMDLADDVVAIMRFDDRPVFVLGIGTRTPLLTARLDVPASGVLADGVARRAGIVTPEDLTATVLEVLGVPVAADAGRPMVVEPAIDPLVRLDALATRLERDVDYAPHLTRVTAGAGIAAVVLGTLAMWLRRRRLAAALVRAGAMVPAGYLGALFINDSRWQVRAVVVLGAFLFGLVFATGSTRRLCGWILLLSTFAVAAVTLAAAASPDAEPAMSLWGNPLVSWRFFGLRNHLAAFLAGGYLVGASLLAFPAWLIGLGGVAVGVVVGAPTLGANFIAVLTLAFGVSLVLLARAAGRVRPLHLPIAAVVAAGATLAVLVADAGSPASHGGRAVASVRAGGLATAWDIVARRARLNLDLITGLGIIGVAGFVLAALALAWIFVWALRAEGSPFSLRAGVAGVAAAALVALVVEDSGFYVGGLMGLYPWIGFAADGTDRLSAVAAPRMGQRLPVPAAPAAPRRAGDPPPPPAG